MKIFEEPKIEVMAMEAEDIITASNQPEEASIEDQLPIVPAGK